MPTVTTDPQAPPACCPHCQAAQTCESPHGRFVIYACGFALRWEGFFRPVTSCPRERAETLAGQVTVRTALLWRVIAAWDRQGHWTPEVQMAVWADLMAEVRDVLYTDA